MKSARPVGSCLLIGLALAGSLVVAGDAPLGLADLEAYRLALAAKPDASAPTVGFRDLWDHPQDHLGKPVAIEGRLARLFRQPSVGDFPALAEAWVISPAGDPFCLVFPQPEATAAPEVGAVVRFSGTFLKKVEYQGGDVPRLAPLVVGPTAPAVTSASSAPAAGAMDWSQADWMMACGACLVFALVLARRHLARPSPRAPSREPPPTFVDGEPDPAGGCA